MVAVSTLALYAAATAVNLSKTDIFPHEETMIWAAMNMMPPVVGARLLAGVMAAALSSATTFLSLVGFSVSNDVLSGNKDDDKAMLRFSRQVMLLVGAVALMISFFMPPNLFWLTYYVGTVFASSWGPVAFMSIWSDTITSRAAYWGIISGFAGNVIPRFLDSMGWIELPSYLNPILVGGLISLVVVICVSRLGKVSDTERARRLTLPELPEEERDAEQAKRTQWAAIAVAVFGVCVSALLIIYYVHPYQSATGTLRAGRQLDWFTAEALLSLAWAGHFVPCGITAYKMIGRSYRQ